MKCTQCGNESFIEGLSFPIRIDEYWRIAPTFKMYVCDKCGHVEFFYSGAIEENNELNDIQKEFEDSTEELRNNITNLQNLQDEMGKKAKNAFDTEVKKLEAIIADESVTVAIYKQAQADLDALKKYNFTQKLELCGLDPADFPTRRQIGSLQGQYTQLEKEHEKKVNLIKRKYQL